MNLDAIKLFGPPGTGKTKAILSAIELVIENGVSPSDIGFFSFTNAAVEEGKDRVIKKFPNYDIHEDFEGFRTIHALAKKNLLTSFNKFSNFIIDIWP